MVKEFNMSIHRACKAMKLNHTMYYYQPKKQNDNEIIEALNTLAEKFPRQGFWKFFKRLRNMGYGWNHKRVHRVYKALGLNIRRKTKKRVPDRIKEPLAECLLPNEVWSMDFMSDTLYSGRRYRVLNIIDEFNREFVEIEVDSSLPASRVVKTLERAIEWRGIPQHIRVDNGPEFISLALEIWCAKYNITLKFIQPGKPTQNARVERFNGSMRRELLDTYIFHSLKEVRVMTKEWMEDYNHYRPHDALNDLTPIQYLLEYNQRQKNAA